jgi:cephalosporin-C deacetylase
VDAVIATVPDFCNHSTKRKGSGPEVFRTLSYYDVSVAADLIKVPALIGVGFIDATCRPTGIYAAYNTLAGPKFIENFYTIGHGSPANWRTQTIEWIHSNIETQK